MITGRSGEALGWTVFSSETGTAVGIRQGEESALAREMPGPAGSSPVVWEDRIFVTSANGEKLELIALDTSARRSGRPSSTEPTVSCGWTAPIMRLPPRDRRQACLGDFQRRRPCTVSDFAGRQVWKVDLQERYGKFDIQFGMANTPVLDRGRLYHQLLHGNMQDDAPGSASCSRSTRKPARKFGDTTGRARRHTRTSIPTPRRSFIATRIANT